jgi:hypothetical protein
MIRFGPTIFLSAFLLFQVQPVITRFILPWFGGGPAVWGTCLVFFQVVLLAGYFYAHVVSELLPRRLHVWLHLGLLGASLWMLPIVPDAGQWKPLTADAPESRILMLLLVTVGLPYGLLSSTAPLVQRWYSLTASGEQPYRLYALSNAGSLLALLSYPVLVEPVLRLRSQARGWSWAYVVFAGLSAWCALSTLRRSGQAGPTPVAETGLAAAPPAAGAFPPPAGTIVLWLLLSACGSALLLATTNQLCQEISVVPFLWILPLALYLLSFILCFEHERWYNRAWFGLPLVVLVPATCALISAGLDIDLRIHILVYSAALFVACMILHGEMAQSKPHPRYLTLFYLVVAAGGALGGILVAFVAPRIFSGYWEYPLMLAAACALAALAWRRAGFWGVYAEQSLLQRALLTGLVGAFLSALVFVWANTRAGVVIRTRNFYGVLRVTDHTITGGQTRILTNGNTLHGSQWLDPKRRRQPTTYYGYDSGIGMAIEFHPRRFAPRAEQRALKVGTVGLGAGTVAALARAGDTFRFYEINPAVVKVSETYFHYLEDSPAATEIVLGDARLQLEAELLAGKPQAFDVLAVDAFSSDAIPIHLLTREAVEIYWKHMAEDGLLLFHISNHSLDLAPIVRAHAAYLGCQAVRITARLDEEKDTNYNTWLVLTRNQQFLDLAAVRSSISPWQPDERAPVVWTDDFASLWHILKF